MKFNVDQIKSLGLCMAQPKVLEFLHYIVIYREMLKKYSSQKTVASNGTIFSMGHT